MEAISVLISVPTKTSFNVLNTNVEAVPFMDKLVRRKSEHKTLANISCLFGTGTSSTIINIEKGVGHNRATVFDCHWKRE